MRQKNQYKNLEIDSEQQKLAKGSQMRMLVLLANVDSVGKHFTVSSIRNIVILWYRNENQREKHI